MGIRPIHVTEALEPLLVLKNLPSGRRWWYAKPAVKAACGWIKLGAVDGLPVDAARARCQAARASS